MATKPKPWNPPPYNEGDALYVPMNRTAFVAVLAIVALLTLAASLPERFYRADPKMLVLSTAIACGLGALGLGLYLAIGFPI